MTVAASKVRKGTLIVVDGVKVRVTRREKWNTKTVRVHFEDAGHGLPVARFGANMLTIQYKSLDLNAEIEVAP